MRKFFVAAVALALVPSVVWAQSTRPSIGVTGAGALGTTTRQNLGTYPTMISAMDPGFGVAGDAIRGYAASVSITSGATPTLSLPAYYQIDGATVSCVIGQAPTVTLPGGALPGYIGTGLVSFRINLPGCGGSGGTLNGAINSAPSGTAPGPYSFTLDTAVSTAFAGTESVYIYANTFAAGNNNTSQGAAYALWHLGTGSISGKTLTMPTNTFNVTRDTTLLDASGLFKTFVAIDDPSGTCPQYRGYIVSASSTTTATLSTAPTCTPGGSLLAVWWGTFMFPSNIATGPTFPGTPWNCEVLGAGASGASLVSAVSAYLDPFHVTLASASSTSLNQSNGSLTCGTPDDTALDNVAQAALVIGAGSLYLPPNHNYFMAGGNVSHIGALALCADGNSQGHIFWTQTYPELRNGMRCTPSQDLPLVRKTLNANLNLKHSQSVTGRNLVAGIFSDSLFQNTSNGMGAAGSGGENLSNWLSTATGKTVTFYPYSIGGTLLAELAPNLPGNTSGNGVGIPTTSQIASVSVWYTNSSTKWINYGLAKCWDVVFLEFQNDQYSFLESTFYDVNGYINTAWLSSCGFVPDIIWITGPGQSTTAYSISTQESNLFQQDFIRSAVMAGNTMPPGVSLPAGQAVGLLDFGGRFFEATKGYSVFNPPMTRANDIVQFGSPTNQGPQIKWPYTWPRKVRDYQLATSFSETVSNVTTSYFWNTYLGGSWNVPLGNGIAGTPYSVNGQSSPLQVGYPNNMVSISRDTASGNLAVTGYTHRISETATCSMTSVTLTCTTPVANWGYYYDNIAIQGAGSATCPTEVGGTNCLLTTIAAAGVSANGQVITTVATGSLSSSSIKLVIYHQFLPTLVTSVSAAINNGSDSSPSCSVCTFLLGFGISSKPPFLDVTGDYFATSPVFQGAVPGYGGRYSPVFTAGWAGSYSGLTPANQFNYPQVGVSSENADDFVLYTPTMPLDYNCWGSPPGYIGPEGGGWSAHMATGCFTHILNDVLAANDFQTTLPSFLPAPSTVSALPTCNSSRTGVVLAVTDASTPAYGVALTGGSTSYALALCNGSSWLAH